MECVESRKRNCSKCIRTTYYKHIRNTGADEFTGICHADASRCACIADVGNDSGCTHTVCNMVCYGRNSHLSDVISVFTIYNVVLNTYNTADAASHYYTESGGVFLAHIDARILECFLGSLQAKL